MQVKRFGITFYLQHHKFWLVRIMLLIVSFLMGRIYQNWKEMEKMPGLTNQPSGTVTTPVETQVGAYNTYIGERYVPIFANPIEWNINTQYEPLTIVTYQGNSFTSRQYVPSGIQINNNEFWAQTGNFNSQLGSLQNQLNTNTQDINNLKSLQSQPKYTVFVADSYGDSPTGAYSWTALISQYLINTNYSVVQQSGSGFLTTSPPSFTALLDNVDINIRDYVTDVVVETALNDYASSKSAWVTGINAFIDKAQNLFPGLQKIHIIPIIISADRIPYKYQFFSMLSDVNIKKPIFYPQSFSWLHNSAYMVSDNLHLSSIGAQELAKLIGFYINGNAINGDPYVSNYNLNTSIQLSSWCNGETIGYYLNGSYVVNTRGKQFILGGLPASGTSCTLLKSNNTFIIGNGVAYGSDQVVYPFTLQTLNGDLVINTLANIDTGISLSFSITGEISCYHN